MYHLELLCNYFMGINQTITFGKIANLLYSKFTVLTYPSGLCHQSISRIWPLPAVLTDHYGPDHHCLSCELMLLPLTGFPAPTLALSPALHLVSARRLDDSMPGHITLVLKVLQWLTVLFQVELRCRQWLLRPHRSHRPCPYITAPWPCPCLGDHGCRIHCTFLPWERRFRSRQGPWPQARRWLMPAWGTWPFWLREGGESLGVVRSSKDRGVTDSSLSLRPGGRWYSFAASLTLLISPLQGRAVPVFVPKDNQLFISSHCAKAGFGLKISAPRFHFIWKLWANWQNAQVEFF